MCGSQLFVGVNAICEYIKRTIKCYKKAIAAKPFEDCNHMFSCISTQRDFCAQHTRDDCNIEEINSTCCALCGDSPVDPTAQPCLGDINNYECTITIRSNPSRCYDNQFYSECCESCNNARMDWLPSGNVYVSRLLSATIDLNMAIRL